MLSQILSTLEKHSRKIDMLMDSHEQLRLQDTDGYHKYLFLCKENYCTYLESTKISQFSQIMC